jgi:histidyl-tRNA synthetase
MPVDALTQVEHVLDALSGKGVPETRIVLDLGLAPGLAYYTGFVFEIVQPGSPRVFGGGGRYDGLVRELGHTEDVPALGFAVGLEGLLDLKAGDEESA